MKNVKIQHGYIPGAIGRIATLHGTYYHNHWNFGLYFEAKVATELSEFLLRYNEERDGFWIVLKNGRIEGSIVIDGIHAGDQGAHLRWFIVSESMRGKGIGRKLLDKAICFSRDKEYKSITLWTFEGLDAARHLYENKGFKLVEQKNGVQWGCRVMEQRFELKNRQMHAMLPFSRKPDFCS